MENQKLENKISSAICDIVPEDAFGKISERISVGDIPEKDVVKMKNRGSKIRRVLFPAAAACIFLVVAVVFGFTYYGNNCAVESVIDIDVNPSIEISVNKKDKVLDVVALNDDAKTVIEGISFDKCDVSDVVDAIMSNLVEKGFITSEEDGGILITVRNEDVKKADRIREKVIGKVDEKLIHHKIDATVMGQSLTDVEEAKKFAEENNISVGKAMFIKKLSEKDGDVNPEELAGKPMKEIVREVKHKDIPLDEIVDCGRRPGKNPENKPEDGKIPDGENESEKTEPADIKISETEAKETAVNDAGVNADDVVFKNVRLDVVKNSAVYKIIFSVGETEYFYEVSALDGSILKKHTVNTEEDFDKKPEEIPDGEKENNNRPVDEVIPGNKPVDGDKPTTENNPVKDESAVPEDKPIDQKPIVPEKEHAEKDSTTVDNQNGNEMPGFTGNKK